MEFTPDGCLLSSDDSEIEQIFTIAKEVRQIGEPISIDWKKESHANFTKILFGGLSPQYFPALLPTITNAEINTPSIEVEQVAIGYPLEDENTLYSHIKCTSPVPFQWMGVFQGIYSHKPSGNITPVAIQNLHFTFSGGSDTTVGENICHTRRAFVEGKNLGVFSAVFLISTEGKFYTSLETVDFKRIKNTYTSSLSLPVSTFISIPTGWNIDYDTILKYYMVT